MKDHPMLFTGPMVKAILEGQKTMTRRVVTKRNSELGSGEWDWLALEDAWPDKLWGVIPGLKVPTSKAPPEHCPECVVRLYPRIEPGDRLWVREHWAVHECYDQLPPREIELDSGDTIFYEATPSSAMAGFIGHPRRSIHMPKWATRLWLEVVSVKVEQVQAITEEGAIAEGFTKRGVWWDVGVDWEGDGIGYPDAKDGFSVLWDSLNAKRSHTWESNPWVWVIEFQKEPS